MLKSVFKGALLACAFCLAACEEDIDKSNRYTFTNETIADYLENRSEMFSSIIKIYEQAEMMGTLETYGTYTLFAPTNEAVQRYLKEQYELNDSLLGEADSVKVGVHAIRSPYLEELSDSMAQEIAKTHLLPAKYELVNINNEVLPSQNFNNRYLGVIFKNDSITGDFQILVNNQALITQGDEMAENGVIHIVDQVVNQSTDMICELIAKYNYFSIFSDAIKKTGLIDQFQKYKDLDYDLGLEDALDYKGTQKARYPKFKYYKYTAFVPTNETLKNIGHNILGHGIESVEDLEEYAKYWYKDCTSDDYKDPNNALNRLLSYHFLDCDVPYSKIVLQNVSYGNSESPYYNSEWAFMDNMDRSDYYISHTKQLIKAIKPLSSNDKNKRDNVWLNTSNRQIPGDINMRPHLDVRIIPSNEFTQDPADYDGDGIPDQKDFDQNSLNGTIHPIDGLLIYNEDEMVGNVLNERMRFDFGALLPELMTNNVRYCSKEESGSTVDGAGNVNIPNGYCENLINHSATSAVHYLAPYYWGCTYFGDEFIANNIYDFSYRLPPVPEGTYELRIGYTATTIRAITQFYVNNKICGIPVDLKIAATNPRIGYIADDETEDNGVENDKTMRNHGYMKAPETFTAYFQSTDGSSKKTARSYNGAIRYIITTQKFSGNDNWLRMKQVDENDKMEGMHDYIEMVPTGIVNSYIPEDRL